VQALAGALIAKVEEEYPGTRFPGPYDFEEELFVLDLGGGANIMIRPHVGVRLGLDIRLDVIGGTAGGGGDTTMARAIVGVVFGLQ
jgi:hypothetical protein